MTARGAQSILKGEPAAGLLRSPLMARLAYTWTDGTPRVVPMWFHWTGEVILMGAPPNSPKMRVLTDDRAVALSIDTDEWPYTVLAIRGTITCRTVEGTFPEYVDMARRYLGEEGGEQFLAAARQTFARWVRIALRPEHVRVIDFPNTFPSAWSDAQSKEA
jgi:hypothetical protein